MPDNEQRPRPDENDRDRRKANVILLVAAVVVTGIGIWLMNGLLDARKADECMSSGRRNCYPIDAPAR